MMNHPNHTTAPTWVLVLASMASLMVALDALVVSTALSEIGRDLGASIEALEWTVNAYTISFAVLLMTASVIGDRFGRRRVFVSGLGLFVAASAACALAPGIGWLIVARAVQGAGAAAIMPLALTQISAAFPPERRSWALGIFSSITALSSIVGPVVGGAITEGLAWQWIFWLNVPIGLLGIAFSLVHLRETHGPNTAADIKGLVLVTGSVLFLVWGLVRASALGWGSAEILLLLTTGLLLGLLFVAWELRSAAPMIPMRLFRLRAFAAGNAAMFFLNGGLMSAIFFMAQFQQVALEQGPLAAGVRLLPWGVALVAMAPRAGALAQRLGESSVVVLGLLIQAAGLAAMALLAKPGLAYAEMIVPMVAAGAGFAMAIPVVQKAVVSVASPHEIGKASGAVSMIRQFGGAFGIALAVTAFATAGDGKTPEAFSSGFAAAMGIAAMLSFLGALAGIWLPGRPEVRPEMAKSAIEGTLGQVREK